jgi:hypothetical protein
MIPIGRFLEHSDWTMFNDSVNFFFLLWANDRVDRIDKD